MTLPSAEFAALLEAFRSKLERQAASWLTERRRETATYAPEAEILLDSLEQLVLSGGKRLRPALVYFTYEACGGALDRQVLPLALSTELLHSYLLIHDDIMDHAELRRGKPTVHERFRRRHADSSWPGDAADYGRSMAILVGDLAHTCAVELFASVQAEPAQRRALDNVFFRMSREVIDGQYLEMHMGLGDEPGEEDLRRVLRLKSGLYSVERPMQLGALLAGASAQRLEVLTRYGRAVGEAFQLRDDLLGLFGDPEAVGKPVGDDLREGKHTFVIHHALRLADPEGAGRLRRALGRADLDDAEVAAVCDVVRESGAVAEVERMIEQRSREARTAITSLDLVPAGKAFLLGLVGYLETRQQ